MAAHPPSSNVSRPIYPAPASQPAGTFAPGTKVQVGNHRVVVEKYLSEGGFAHVYVVRLPAPDGGQAVLKRVAVPDKDALASMRTEVETMKKLKGHARIVSYMDSHASQLKAGGYEVFLLMEYCQGGGLIDFMNTRLKDRLTEPEILEIFSDAAEGIACMHYLKPPLLHRDLKVENILISKVPTRTFKLCDFGSASPPRPAATNAAEGRLIEEDVQKNTTLQYRSPEMIDVYRKRPIDEKSDIWALGVFLYKLCYYTTPFEDQGQMAILSASFKYPAYPVFSDRLKRLIAMSLMEDPSRRPNIYQVMKEVCSMRGKSVPIKDIYATRTHSEARNMHQLPPRESSIPNVMPPPASGATIAAPEQPKQYMPDITPMRRGRPTTSTNPQSAATKPTPSPGKTTSGDPFAALDSKNYDDRVKAVTELSNKFPAIEDFSLLQNKDAKFEFNNSNSKATKAPPQAAQLNQRVTNALADEAFARPSPPRAEPAPVAQPVLKTRPEPKSKPIQIQQTEPVQAQKPKMVSTGTMTSPRQSPEERKPPEVKAKTFAEPAIWRVPQSDDSIRLGAVERFDSLTNKRHSGLRDFSRSPNPEGDGPASSRPSLEGGRPLPSDLEGGIHRSKSAHTRHEMARARTPPVEHSKRDSFFRRNSHRNSKHLDPASAEFALMNEPNIESDVDYLRAREEEEAASRSLHRRSSSTRRAKHTSLSGISGSTKSLLSGRIGDTFRRFEGGLSSSRHQQQPNESAVPDDDSDYISNQHKAAEPVLDDEPLDETEDLSPEMRRELERRQLEHEERRVEEAAQAYRARVAANGSTGGGPNRASAIQARVKNLLDESGRASPVKRTAEGYGRYTPTAAASPLPVQATDSFRDRATNQLAPPPDAAAAAAPPVVTSAELPRRSSSIPTSNPTAVAAPVAEKPLPLRPSAPPKPVALRTGGGSAPRTPAGVPVKPAALQVRGPDAAAAPPQPEDPDWEASFAKRYPRLSLELVDAESTGGTGDDEPIGRKSVGGRPLRVRDV